MTALDELTAALAPEGQAAVSTPVVLPPLDPSDKRLRTRGILRRRSCAIMGYNGYNGQGKTADMVRDTLLGLALGVPVLSTVTLLDPHTGNPHPLFTPLESWDQVYTAENCEILLDEVTGVLDSRDGSSGMPKKLRKMLPQLRRRNVTVRWTGINWDNSDRRLRQLTQAVAICRGYMPVKGAMRDDGTRDAVPLWAPNRLFSIVTYDASTLTKSEDEGVFTQDKHKQRKAKVLNREWWYGPKSVAFRCYNTLDAVLSISNLCPICEGRIPEKVCKGH